MADMNGKRKSSGFPRAAVVRLLNTELSPALRASDEAIDLLRECAKGWSQLAAFHSDPIAITFGLDIPFKTRRMLYSRTDANDNVIQPSKRYQRKRRCGN